MQVHALESPTVVDAVKNYIAAQLAGELVASALTLSHTHAQVDSPSRLEATDGEAAKWQSSDSDNGGGSGSNESGSSNGNSNGTSSVNASIGSPQFDATAERTGGSAEGGARNAGATSTAADMQVFARAFLAAVNDVAVPEALKERMRSLEQGESGAKPSRVFGRSLVAFPGHFALLRSTALPRVSPSQREAFDSWLGTFERSFADGVVSADEVSLGELVWTADLSSVLRARAAARRARAASNADVAAQQQGAAALSHLVSDGLSHAPTGETV